MAAAVTVALLALVALGTTGPARIALALGFVTFVPGWAALGHSRMVDGVSKIALAVAVSLTVCTAAATVMLWLRPWRPIALFYGLGATSLAGLLWGTTRTLRPAEPAVAPMPVDVSAPAASATDDVAPPAEPRRSTVEPESLGLSRVAVRVAFLPRPPFAAKELVEFFAAINERHPFTDFHRDGEDGAVMETNAARRLEIRRDRVEYSEAAPLGFQESKQHVIDLLGEMQRHFQVGALVNPSFRLHVTLGPGAAGAFPSRRLVDAALQHASLLGGTGPIGVGLRFTGQSDDPRYTWQAILEPDGRDGPASLEVTTDFALSAENPYTVGGCLEHAYGFVTTGVVPFVEAVAASPVDQPSSSDGRNLDR